ncbi:MAG: PilZ domain-containing protein [Gammaproteobacteria bacterium]|nr:PilZ domain-containing protein [Gammaproteobacteria bacterium]MDH5736644.1 PilZ domain-containing protein [Gammaproteobacteria bacterium]
MIQRETRQASKGAQVSLKKSSPGSNNGIEDKYPVDNISRGGLRFSCNQTFDIDERVELTLFLSNGHVHNLHGRICYCQNNNKNHDYGISFLDPYLAFE